MRNRIPRKSLAIAFCAAAVLAVMTLPYALPGDEKPKRANEEAAAPGKAPKQDAADKPVSISKKEIYTTSAEAGFKKQLVAAFYSKDDKPVYPYSHDLRVIESGRTGASNIFLVRGDDIATAVIGTRLVFASGHPADTPPARDLRSKEIKSKKYWLVVYLGAGFSTPPKWDFVGAKVSKNTVEFSYKACDPIIASGDTIQYFYWLPMPQAERGTHELKLIDTDKGRPVLIRYVDIP